MTWVPEISASLEQLGALLMGLSIFVAGAREFARQANGVLKKTKK
jgi:hypothetical protein